MNAASGIGHSRRWAPVIAALVATLLLSASAQAAEPTRDEYVGQLEAICKPGALATQQVMKGARADVRAEQLSPAAHKFAKASEIFGSTLTEMSAVPRPEADAPKLSKWFGYLTRQRSYLGQITTQLRQQRAIQAQRLTARFIHNGNLANNVVLAFGFDYCSFKFSRYG